MGHLGPYKGFTFIGKNLINAKWCQQTLNKTPEQS